MSGLDLRARRIVEGLRAGSHVSPRAGGAVEFDRHRPYQPGEDLRHLDWKVFARSDRLVLKRARMETSVDISFLVDTSGSMSFGSTPDAGSKFQLASSITQALAWLAVDAGDQISVWRCGDPINQACASRGGPVGLQNTIETLQGMTIDDQELNFHTLGEVVTAHLQRPSLIVVVSDLFAPNNDVQRCLGQLRHAGHDVIVIQVVDQAEREFLVPDEVRLEDLESGTAMRVRAQTVREEYLEAWRQHQQFMESVCHGLSIDRALVEPQSSPVPALQAILRARQGGPTLSGRMG